MNRANLPMLYIFHLHVFFSIVFFFGVFLLFHWVKTNLPAKKQKALALYALVIGSVTVLLTVPFCLAGWRLMMGV